jgi:preprotein translocase subunit SecE
MSAKADTSGSPLDKLKLAVAGLLFGAVIVAYHYFDEQSGLYRAIGVIAVAAISLGIALTTTPGRAGWGFAREARQELRKVIWPTRKEALQTTMVVVVMVTIVAAILWLLDVLFRFGVEQLVVSGG